jgi:hypothetical protein
VARFSALIALLPRLSLRSRILLATVAGIVVGVLLLATGLALLQLLGAIAIGAALLLARAGSRLSDAWWSDPRGQLTASRARVRGAIPTWGWQATVLGLVGFAAVVMVGRLLTAGNLGLGTLGELGKGAIALLMMASLALWSTDGAERRFGRWISGWSARRGGGGKDGEQLPEEALG